MRLGAFFVHTRFAPGARPRHATGITLGPTIGELANQNA